MDNEGSTPQGKTPEHIKSELLEQLRQRQIEWIRAADQERDAARQRFLEILHSYNRLVRDDDVPKDQ